jgi:hypothetical protein
MALMADASPGQAPSSSMGEASRKRRLSMADYPAITTGRDYDRQTDTKSKD